jgi:O-acetyl-ADP-ribose deacetylase (regulator of RNase III)
MACYNLYMSQVLRAHPFLSGRQFEIVRGDITLENVDAIVNAANEWLKHGGGVAGVISRRGGPEIQRDSDQLVQERGPVSHSDPAYTSAGRLPCKYVIHAVGPVWGSGEEDDKLDAAVRGSLRVADELRLKSLALPAISTGIFGFPKGRAAGIIFRSIHQYFNENPSSGLELVRLTLFDQLTVDVFLQVWDEWIAETES